jgi:hypothetical protein
MKGHSSRLKQVENRMSGLKDKIDIKQTNKKKITAEELLDKRPKSCKRNMQEFNDQT